MAKILNVSIPFKRESGFRVSNDSSFGDDGDGGVSIPFKRESGFRVTVINKVSLVYSLVSIPFKRESGFRGSGATFRKK